MTMIVQAVIFDCIMNGRKFKNVMLPFGADGDDVDQEYLFNEDGPWFAVPLGNKVFDFQVFGQNESCGEDKEVSYSIDTLGIQAYEMHRNKDGCWEHGDWVSENFEFSNVRVNYKPEKDAKIWLRLGVNLTATPQEIEAITKNNDVSLLKSLIAKGNFEIDGDSYIPADSVQEYYDSNPNLQAPDEIGDIEFNI